MVKALVVALCLAALVAGGVAVGQTERQRPSARTLADFPPATIDPTVCKQRPLVNPTRIVCRIEVTVIDATDCKPVVAPAATWVHKAAYKIGGLPVQRENFVMLWVLKLDGGGNINNLSFARGNGIEVLQDAAKPEFGNLEVAQDDENGEPKISLGLPHRRVLVQTTARSASNPLPSVYHYNVTVQRNDGHGNWVRCGYIDPLIVNTD